MPKPKTGLRSSPGRSGQQAGKNHLLASQEAQDREALRVPLERLKLDPNQPRKHFDDPALMELAESIRDLGVLQPLLVLRVGDDYQVVAGERRYRAAEMVGLPDVPVRVFTDQERVLEAQLIENLQREELSLYDEAVALAELMRKKDLSLRDLETSIGKSKSYIDRRVRLLEMPEDVQEMVRCARMNLTQAEEVAKIKSPSQRKARILALTGQVEPPEEKVSKRVGRPANPFKFKQKKDGGFELVVKYLPGQSDLQVLIQQVRETLEKLENDKKL